jgi:hypothetical protein
MNLKFGLLETKKLKKISVITISIFIVLVGFIVILPIIHSIDIVVIVGEAETPSPPENNPPNANASASETFGFINELILFDASLSSDRDGIIIEYIWDFGDGEFGYGVRILHNYSNIGSYLVKLTVKDDDEATDFVSFEVIVTKGNNPPTKPIVDGPKMGHKNVNYEFTALSFDVDNDTIQYTFNWGDGQSTETEFLQNGTIAHLFYNWTNYGEYKISVKAYDGETESAKYEYTIFIDVYPIDDEIVGYLIDDDSDDSYNSFNDSDTNYKSDVKKDNDTYLIDTDLDGKWDYAYNLDLGLSTYYEFLYNKYLKIYQETPGFEFISLLVMIVLLFIIYKRRK